MSDVWELVSYVEGHPDNQEQRWRLSKKLFKENEYRLALEHLFILKNEWPDRVHVIRYLAATYFRLKRYDEATKELKRAIGAWPNDVGLYEQLAHTCQAADRLEEAADTWEKLAALQPKHPHAKKSASRLREIILSGSQHDYNEADLPMPRESVSDAGMLSCPACGAENAPELKQCWQCKAPLRSEPASAFEVRQQQTSNVSLEGILYALAGVFAVAGLALTAMLGPWTTGASLAADAPALTAEQFIQRELGTTRVYLGLLLLVAWPVVFNFFISFTLYDPRKASPFGAGVFVATLTYLASWTPTVGVWLAPLVGLAASVGCVVGALGLTGAPRIAKVAVSQAGAMLALCGTLLAALHGFGFVGDLGAIARFANRGDASEPVSIVGETPMRFDFQYTPTGSAWLDRNAGRGELEVGTLDDGNRATIEILSAGESVYYRNVGPDAVRLTLPHLVAGQEYTLTIDDIRGREGQPLSLTVRGLLQPVLEPTFSE